MTAGLTWNLTEVIRELLSFHFMVNALRAGTIVAVVAGAWVLVNGWPRLRRGVPRQDD